MGREIDVGMGSCYGCGKFEVVDTHNLCAVCNNKNQKPDLVKGTVIPVTQKFKDSGERRDFNTGAVRDMSSGKGRFDLVPDISLFLVSRIYEEGCKKYGDRNWEKGIPINSFVDSAQRHLAKYKAGLRDEPHLSMAAWNIFCALWTATMVSLGLRPKELFNLPNHISNDNIKPLSDFELDSVNTFLGKSHEQSDRNSNPPSEGFGRCV